VPSTGVCAADHGSSRNRIIRGRPLDSGCGRSRRRYTRPGREHQAWAHGRPWLEPGGHANRQWLESGGCKDRRCFEPGGHAGWGRLESGECTDRCERPRYGGGRCAATRFGHAAPRTRRSNRPRCGSPAVAWRSGPRERCEWCRPICSEPVCSDRCRNRQCGRARTTRRKSGTPVRTGCGEYAHASGDSHGGRCKKLSDWRSAGSGIRTGGRRDNGTVGA
jgi:hypothetical protein